MKLITLTTLFAIAPFCPGLAIAKDSGSTEQALIKIEQELTDGLIKKDTSAFERHLADNGVFTDPDGKVMTKSQLIADIKSGDLKIDSSKIDDMKVHVFKDTAVVTYATADTGTYKGKPITGRYRWTDTFVKNGGRWQIVAGQGTKVAQ